MLELDYASLKSKLDNITRNVSNFNKGRENLSNIIKNSQSTSNKRGIGYSKKHIAPPKSNHNRRLVSKPKSIIENSRKKIDEKSIKIWVPKTNNNLIRNKYIKTFIEKVHKNQDYVYKGNTESTWVWFPKT